MKICILGAGVIGLSAAWLLSERGHDVTLVERHAAPGAEASAANGGQLSYSFVAPLASPDTPRALPSLLLSPASPVRISPSLDLIRWGAAFLRCCTAGAADATTAAQLALAALSRGELERLATTEHLSFGLATPGKLVLYRAAGSFAAARRATARKTAAGAKQLALTPAECLTLEPALRIVPRQLAGGVFTPSEQVGDCALFCRELDLVLRRRNSVTRLMGTTILRPVVSGAQLIAVETTGGAIEADAFVVSLGASSAAFARACGFHLPVYPVKGYSITVPANGAMLRHSVTDFDRRMLFAPLQQREARVIRIAGFADFVGHDRSLDPARIDALAVAAATMLNIDGTTMLPPWTGLRPMTPDSRPVIGPSPVGGLYLNTGHGMLGWTLACGSARLLADMIDGETPPIAVAPFAAARFA